jgi:hypothetical protein
MEILFTVVYLWDKARLDILEIFNGDVTVEDNDDIDIEQYTSIEDMNTDLIAVNPDWKEKFEIRVYKRFQEQAPYNPCEPIGE